jgi:hypothetical protein
MDMKIINYVIYTLINFYYYNYNGSEIVDYMNEENEMNEYLENEEY